MKYYELEKKLYAVCRDLKNTIHKLKKDIWLCKMNVSNKRKAPDIMNASDILTFFTKSIRNKNDATNKIRENILKIIGNPPKDYLTHSEYGPNWCLVQKEWNEAIGKIAEDTNVPAYTSVETRVKGGRRSNYDADIEYHNDSTLVAKRKIEFKNGGTSIDGLPQFLSQPVKGKFGLLFPVTYDKFFYENYLDRYLACDAGLTESKPTDVQYLKQVSKDKNDNPFFVQLKERRHVLKEGKNLIVNNSITDYLTQYGSSINLEMFTEKIKTTQTDKIFLLWSQGKFYTDKLHPDEMSNMTFHGIKNGNVLEIKAGQTIYGLLLRWKNSKGILYPAWQISMKRI